jgi:hypothetical protein
MWHAVKHQQSCDYKGADVDNCYQYSCFLTDEIALPAALLAIVFAIGCLQISGVCRVNTIHFELYTISFKEIFICVIIM